jgi:hypothetical protein
MIIIMVVSNEMVVSNNVVMKGIWGIEWFSISCLIMNVACKKGKLRLPIAFILPFCPSDYDDCKVHDM